MGAREICDDKFQILTHNILSQSNIFEILSQSNNFELPREESYIISVKKPPDYVYDVNKNRCQCYNSINDDKNEKFPNTPHLFIIYC